MASAAALVDEQDCVPEYPSYMTGMYFDELYHARTAYEHLHNLSVYEVSHPPLGKIIHFRRRCDIRHESLRLANHGCAVRRCNDSPDVCVRQAHVQASRACALAAGLFAFDFSIFRRLEFRPLTYTAVFFNMCMTYYMYKFIKRSRRQP